MIPEWAIPNESRRSAHSSRSVLSGTRNSRWVKTRNEFVERPAKAEGVFDEADLQVCARFDEAGVALALVRRFICTAEGESEEFSIPHDASFEVGDCERWS